jgi:hypothetical protein
MKGETGHFRPGRPIGLPGRQSGREQRQYASRRMLAFYERVPTGRQTEIGA